ncbi:hypothetical protein M0802_015313 [Mischocyttarus mexicanus]|nr:hypothetical protein M0802_016960 [Mischocyttarus mexicanus]KAI4475054.1 hypothetical protein M0802_015313 [Mischocyttarus mexicanus]
MDGRRNSTDPLTSIVAHQDGYRRVQQTQYTRPRSSYLGNRLINRSSHLVRKPGVRSTIESLTKVLSFIVARSLSSTKGLYSKSSSARILSVYSVGRLETEWLVVSGKVGPMGVAARSSTLGGDENST